MQGSISPGSSDDEAEVAKGDAVKLLRRAKIAEFPEFEASVLKHACKLLMIMTVTKEAFPDEQERMHMIRSSLGFANDHMLKLTEDPDYKPLQETRRVVNCVRCF
jgi:hypothetical protein